MNNNYCNAFSDSSDSQDVETIELIQEEHNLIPLPPLMTQKLDANQHLKRVDNEGGISSRPKHGTVPKADILGLDIAEKYRGKWIFNCEANSWMVYELDQVGIWSKVNDYYIEGLINQELKEQEIAGYGNSGYITNIIHKLKLELIEVGWKEQSPTELLPFQNCVLEIATGNVINHSPKHRFTWCLPREFDNSSNEFPLIEQWLDEVTNNDQSIKEILLCYLAAILKGRADLQQFLQLVGSGGTGKSTFIKLAQSLIGDNNVCTITLVDLCKERFAAANALKKRLVVFPDQDRYRGEVQKFKSLTGQDFIFAEEKGKQGFQFKFDGMVIMASNDPVFDGRNSSWLTRRQILVPFNKTVDKNKRRDLEKEFQPELNALTQYLLNISDDTVTQVLRNAADNPELAKHILEQQISSNPIAGWINECVIRNVGSKCQVGSDKTDKNTLFGSYTEWCRKSGSYPPSLRYFSPELLDFCKSTMGWKDVNKVRHNKGVWIYGLRLREVGKDNDIPSPLEVSVESSLHGEE